MRRQHSSDLRRYPRLSTPRRDSPQIPDADSAVAGSADHEPLAWRIVHIHAVVVQDIPVTVEFEAQNTASVTRERCKAPAGLETPDLDSAIAGPSDDPRRVELQTVHAMAKLKSLSRLA